MIYSNVHLVSVMNISRKKMARLYTNKFYFYLHEFIFILIRQKCYGFITSRNFLYGNSHENDACKMHDNTIEMNQISLELLNTHTLKQNVPWIFVMFSYYL